MCSSNHCSSLTPEKVRTSVRPAKNVSMAQANDRHGDSLRDRIKDAAFEPWPLRTIHEPALADPQPLLTLNKINMLKCWAQPLGDLNPSREQFDTLSLVPKWLLSNGEKMSKFQSIP